MTRYEHWQKGNNKISYFRHLEKLSQTDLARLAGIPQPNVSKAESGSSSFETKRRIAKVFGKTIVEVFPSLAPDAVCCEVCGVTDVGVKLQPRRTDSKHGMCWECCLKFAELTEQCLQEFTGDAEAFYPAETLVSIFKLAEGFYFDKKYDEDYCRGRKMKGIAHHNVPKNKRDPVMTADEVNTQKRELFMEKLRRRGAIKSD